MVSRHGDRSSGLRGSRSSTCCTAGGSGGAGKRCYQTDSSMISVRDPVRLVPSGQALTALRHAGVQAESVLTSG